MLMFVYFAAVHNNSFLLIPLGLPFDRALPWHKLLAGATIFASFVHGATFYIMGRADALVDGDAYELHHGFRSLGITRAYGMEISGAQLLRMCLVAHVVFALALPMSGSPACCIDLRDPRSGGLR